MKDIGFTSSYADPYVWTKSEILKTGRKLYTYIMVYVNNLLIISKYPTFYMDEIAYQFRLKQHSIVSPCYLLGYKYI